jgi:SAM-dependent methyltransferase
MKNAVKKLLRLITIPFVMPDYFRYRSLDRSKRFSVALGDFYPQVKDKTIKTGFDRHYVYHTAWAARAVSQIKPAKHVDISSSLFFSAIVSAFVPVDFYDYRPADLELSGFASKEADLLALPFTSGSMSSLSCLHTIEHVGLGRYGDPLDPEGDIKAARELARVVAPGGNLLIVLPVGRPKIEFNAHRIYSYEQAIELFAGLELKEFALVPEKVGGLVYGADSQRVAEEGYGCGCFWFVKK